MINANEILTNLWLGDIKDATNKEFIDKIDIIINCTKNIPFINDKKKNIRIPVEDNLEKTEIAKLYTYFDSISKIINDNLKKGFVIFVHCYAGKQRSASIIASYIMKYYRINFKETKKLILSKRNHVFSPLPNFISSLKLFERNLNLN